MRSQARMLGDAFRPSAEFLDEAFARCGHGFTHAWSHAAIVSSSGTTSTARLRSSRVGRFRFPSTLRGARPPCRTKYRPWAVPRWQVGKAMGLQRVPELRFLRDDSFVAASKARGTPERAAAPASQPHAHSPLHVRARTFQRRCLLAASHAGGLAD